MSEILTTDAPQLSANDLTFAKEMAEALHSAYPNHLWAVTCDGVQGVATIRNLALSGLWGYRLLLPKIYSMSQFRAKVLHAGGEILERFNQRRGKAIDDHLANLELDFSGRTAGDYSK